MRLRRLGAGRLLVAVAAAVALHRPRPRRLDGMILAAEMSLAEPGR